MSNNSKTIIVTGSPNGIGLDITHAFLRKFGRFLNQKEKATMDHNGLLDDNCLDKTNIRRTVMNTKRTLTALATALTLGLTAGQSLADNGYFGVSILDGAQHDYVLEDQLDGHGYENLGSAIPFSGFGVAILDGAEHDYVLDNSNDDVSTHTVVQSDQSFSEFGVAILDDSIHDYVRDDDLGAQSSEKIFASTTKGSDTDQGNRHSM